MNKVLVFGTFDNLHEGHQNLFKQAKLLGDELYVVVARDNTVREVKNKQTRHSQEERLQKVQNHPLVIKAILGTNKQNKAEIILDIKPDIICLGYDQTHFIDQLHELIQKQQLNIPIHKLKPYKESIYKSSLLNKN